MDVNKEQKRSSSDIIKEQNSLSMDTTAEESRGSSAGERREENRSSPDTNKEKKKDKKEKTLTLDKVSLPKIRKTVHKVMKKYYNDKFYRTADFVAKVFKKLNVEPRYPNEKVRIRSHIYRWITTNTTEKDGEDSKKAVLAEIKAANLKSQEITNAEIIVFDTSEKQTTEEQQVQVNVTQTPTLSNKVCINCKKCINEKETSAEPTPTTLDKVIEEQNIVKTEIKEIPLIDLTFDDKEIKEEIKEDESSKLIPNGTDSQGTSQEASYYAQYYQPNMWWYPYYYQNYNYMPSTYLPTSAYSNLNSNNYSNNLNYTNNYENNLNSSNNYYPNYYYQ